jgi:Holliday junction resolvase RusA-like endonuclease
VQGPQVPQVAAGDPGMSEAPGPYAESAQPLTFVVYGDPRAKGRPRHMRNGHTYTPAETQEAEYNFRSQAVRFLPSGGMIPAGTPIRLTLLFYMPIPASWSNKKQNRAGDGLIYPTGRPDLDNLIKLAKDSLNGIFWHDDSQVVSYGELTGKYYATQPRTEVIIERMGE